jgi:hypothetical protein
MDLEADFPAAHSMDTEWFTVDKDGHVAVFDSGEAGAVPVAAGTDEEGVLLLRLAACLPAVLPLFDLKEWVGPGDAPETRHIRPEIYGDYYRILMFLETLDPIRDALGTALVAARPGAFGHAVFFEEGLTPELFRRIHAAGACLACVSLFEHPDWPTRLGLYRYSHTCDNWISGPYAQDGRPDRPLRIDDVPPEFRATFERMRFDTLRFAETEEIQPVDHGPCHSWESAYLALDRKTVRPLPGREQEYRERYEEMSDGSDLQCEPPPA